MVTELLPGQSEALGLLALLLVHDARRDARVDARGDLVLLADQDRSRWDRPTIERATGLADTRAPARAPGPLRPAGRDRARARERPQLRGHTLGSRCRLLLASRRAGTRPVVELNRAVAIAMAGDLRTGLDRIEQLAGQLDSYRYFHAARADLLRRLGERDAAAQAYARALELAGSTAERAFLQRRLDQIHG